MGETDVAATLRSPAEIIKLRDSGRLLARVLDQVTGAVRPGVSTLELDELAFEIITAAGAQPSFLGYAPEPGITPFPGSICASVNRVVVHGIPGPEKLAAGDLITIDCGVLLEGWHTDSAVTIAVGPVDERLAGLLLATETALADAIPALQPGNHLGDVGAIVQESVARAGFAVIPELGGHGIGRAIWEEPQVRNYGRRGEGVELVAGMVLAIEPIVSAGGTQLRLDPDRWTVRTADDSVTAHFEHTVAIIEDGPLVLTATGCLF
jgi:methionyl aminopeptidase